MILLNGLLALGDDLGWLLHRCSNLAALLLPLLLLLKFFPILFCLFYCLELLSFELLIFGGEVLKYFNSELGPKLAEEVASGKVLRRLFSI